MDTLTFSTPILYRHLTFSEAKKQPISEINLVKALEGLEMDMSQVSSPCNERLRMCLLTTLLVH
jgi:flap endonuclease-1